MTSPSPPKTPRAAALNGQRSPSRSALLAAELGRRIVAGVHAPDATLPPESAVLAEFGISRTVLRDAVKSLESKGLLEARQRRGTCVTPRSRWNLLDAEVLGWIVQTNADPELLIRLTEVRLIVEPGACALAATQRDPAGLQRIESAWQRMVDSADDAESFVAADLDFHLALLSAAGNAYLAAFGTAISAALTVSLRRTNAAARDNRASLPAHQRIVDALRRGDGAAAAAASRHQLDEAMQRLRASTAPR